MRRIFQPVRFLAIFGLIVIFLSHMGIVLLAVRQRWPRVKLSNRILHRYSRIGLWIFNVKVNPTGLENIKTTGALYVGNHLSYLDVVVISRHLPAGFVTSVEIRDTPFLGLICRMAGCLFVERRSKANLRGEVGELSDGLKNSLNVAIFPEGTSSNGEQIMRFRRPLFLSAIDAGVPVVPFCLNYSEVGGEPINPVSRDSVMWYGDMSFAPHLWALCGSGGITVDLHFLPALSTSPQSEPGEISEIAHQAVGTVFKPVSNYRS